MKTPLKLLGLLVLVACLGAGIQRFSPIAQRLYDFGDAISTQAPLTTRTLFMTNPGRVNLLLLGYGGAGWDGPYLTDTELVISYEPSSGRTALISVPRDLWVEVPANSGAYAKINAAYAFGMTHGGSVEAGQTASDAAAQVVGLDTSHWLSIDFTGFEQLIDTIGGIDITAPETFVALPPSSTPATTFEAGAQHMNGARALLYARARHCTPADQSSDFARAARQQLIVQAIASKLHHIDIQSRLPHVLTAIQPYLATNMSLLDLALLFIHADFRHARHISLSTTGLLKNAVSDDNQAVLLPNSGNWDAIHAYIQDQLNAP